MKARVGGRTNTVFLYVGKESFAGSAKILTKKVIFGTNSSSWDFYLSIIKVNQFEI